MPVYSQDKRDERGKIIPYDIFRDRHPRGKIMSQAHIHMYYELVYVTHGEVTIVCNSSARYVLKEGDVLFVPPGLIHASQVSPDCPYDFSCTITAKFTGQMLYPLANTVSDIKYLVNAERKFDGCFLMPTGSELARIFAGNLELAVSEIEGQKPCFEIALRGYLSVLYANLMRAVAKDGHTAEVPSRVTTKNAQLLCEALSYIEENYHNPLSIQQVADACGITYAQLTYLFSKCFTKGFSEYILDLRITYAQKLLLQTNRQVVEIALDCGFDNSSYFTKKFKATTGMTPKEFRHKYLEAPEEE